MQTSGTSGPNIFPAGSRAPCAAARRRRRAKTCADHRATTEEEGFAFRFLVREKRRGEFLVTGVSRRPIVVAPPAGAIEDIDQAAAVAALEVLLRQDQPTAIAAAGPGPKLLALIGRAAMLHKLGKPFWKIDDVLELKTRTAVNFQIQWPEAWEAAIAAADREMIALARAQIAAPELMGVDGHLRAAGDALEQGAIAQSEKLTLSGFFRDYYRPLRLFESPRQSVEGYQQVINQWVLITGDPPLREITTASLATFRAALAERKGRDAEKLSANTIRRHLTTLQAVLDFAGPPAPRRRDSANILPQLAPWIRKPRAVEKLPEVIPIDDLTKVYAAADAMTWPAVRNRDGSIVPPGQWWRSLISVAFNTQFRRRTLLSLRMSDIDFQALTIRIEGGQIKTKRPMIYPLNPPALRRCLPSAATASWCFPSMPIRRCSTGNCTSCRTRPA